MAVWRFGLKDEIRLQPEGTRVDRYAPHRGRQLAQPGRFAPQIRPLGSAICTYRLQLPLPRKNAQNVSKIRIDDKLEIGMRTRFRRPTTEMFLRNSNTKQDGKEF